MRYGLQPEPVVQWRQQPRPPAGREAFAADLVAAVQAAGTDAPALPMGRFAAGARRRLSDRLRVALDLTGLELDVGGSARAIAALRGVRVDILLPAQNNLWFVHWASRAMWWQVLERGCRLWLTPPPFDHSKLMIVDGPQTSPLEALTATVLTGSANWSSSAGWEHDGPRRCPAVSSKE